MLFVYITIGFKETEDGDSLYPLELLEEVGECSGDDAPVSIALHPSSNGERLP